MFAIHWDQSAGKPSRNGGRIGREAGRARGRIVVIALAWPGAILPVHFAVASAAAAPASDEVQQQTYFEAFKRGQEALQSDDYQAAVAAYQLALDSGPDSARAGDAIYWQAFARYRAGATGELKIAAEALERVLEHYRMSPCRRDAAELVTRIRGELARRGDTASAAVIAARARELEQQVAEHRAQVAHLQVEAEQQHAALLALEEARVARTVAEREAPELPEPCVGAPAPLGPLAPLAPPLGDIADPLRQMALARSRPVAVNEEDDIRMAALTALASMDPERTLPILASVLERRDEDSARLREQALMLLSMHDSAEAERLLLAVAREDPDDSVRGKALLYLGMSSNPAALDLLEQTLRQPGPLSMKEDALSALQMNDHPRALEILRRTAASPEPPTPLRERAIMILGERRSEEDLKLLLRLYEDVHDPALQEAVVLAVGFQRNAITRAWLLRLLAAPDTPPSAREKALFCAGEDPEVPTRLLVDLYPRLVAGETRRHAVLVIGQRQDPEALEFIIRVAREEQEPEARRAAVFFLGESRDPRALEVLRELVTR